MEISRLNRMNRFCPCGSGKIYKDCCRKQKAISITSLIDRELIDLQEQILLFGMEEYEFEIMNDFQTRLNHEIIFNQDEEDLFIYVHLVWFVVTMPVERGKTILQLYIERFSDQVKRPQIREFIKDWVNPRSIVGRLISTSSNYMIVKDLISDDNICVRLLEPLDSSDEALLYGFLLPLGRDWIFFADPIDMEIQNTEKAEKYLRRLWEKSSYTDYHMYLQKEFFEILKGLFLISFTVELENLPWKREEHRQVSVLFEKKMAEDGVPQKLIKTALLLWYQYCEREPLLRKKIETYAGAIHYLSLKVNPLCYVTKKEMAIKYQISPSTLGTAIADLEYVLWDEIRDLLEAYFEQIEEELILEEERYFHWLDNGENNDGFQEGQNDKEKLDDFQEGVLIPSSPRRSIHDKNVKMLRDDELPF